MSDEIPAGKKAQIDGSVVNFSYFEAHQDTPVLEKITPFLSQPIVEALTRIPFYSLQFDGRERGLIRAAFSDCLTPQVQKRQLKIDGGAPFYELVKKNRSLYANHLLSGILASRGWLDCRQLEHALVSSGDMTPDQYLRILSLAGAESWARAWS